MQRSKAQKHITSWLPWPAGCACLLLMLLSTGLSIQAQDLDSRYLMTQIMVEGLPQNSINAIVQTRDGYLWMTTFGGLVRFDGISYTVFDVANTPALPSNRMVALYEDRAGVLWIGHEGGDLTRYQDAVFSNYTEEDRPGGNTYQRRRDESSMALQSSHYYRPTLAVSWRLFTDPTLSQKEGLDHFGMAVDFASCRFF